jgi:glycosyltransferase involved in cell wall biosynthesis
MSVRNVPGSPRKITHVVRSAGVGGVETHVQYVLRLLQAQGDVVSLVSLSSDTPHAKFVELGAPIVTLSDQPAWGWNTVKAGIGLWRALRRDPPDIVHVHGARPILLGSVAARLAGVDHVVCSLHGAHDLMAVRSDGTMSALGAWGARVVHGIGFRLASRIVICAKRLSGDALVSLRSVTLGAARMLRKKERVVYHGIDIRQFDVVPSAKARARESDVDLVVGTLSRLDEPKKGIGVLLNAVAELERRGVRVRLVVAGDGHSRTPLERQARALHLRDCRFLGFVEDARAFYASLDVFALASFSEGMPLVNLEAMACGTTVVTTDVGGAAEAVLDGATGLVVPPGDAGALADAIEALARDPERRRALGTAGRERVREHFSIEAMFRRLSAVYDELFPTKGGAEK